MSSSRRHRERKPGRRAPFRDPKHLILIVCEGEVTEPEYFNGFKNACRNPLVEIRIARERGVPKTLVDIAKRYKKEAEKAARKADDDNLKFDEVWVVFDVDEHPNIPDAVQMARDNQIEVAKSNPSFELWLVLHFRESPGMQGRKVLADLLEGFIDGYDKHIDYKLFSERYPQAVARAKQLDAMAANGGQPDCNPTTGVHRLTESIRVGRSR